MDTPYVFEWLEETSSTQDDARGLFADLPVVVAAAAQSRGRGRGDRRWETAPRALAISVCWTPRWDPVHFGRLPLVAGLAASDVVDAGLKWPNDLVDESGAKVGGILAESSGPVVTIGLGINLYWPGAPEGYAALFADDPGRREDLARAFADRLLKRVGRGSDKWDRENYAARCVTLGSTVTWQPSGAGEAVGIGEGGELIVRTADGTKSLVTGEVWGVRAVVPRTT